MNHSNEPSQFKLHSEYQPTGDQPQAIAELVEGFRQGNQFETLLGVTGSGKTFTMANVIQALNKPTLIIAHNKTLAGQLYGEMKEFFPENAVEYFVSYYDYYQPEAYVPSSDTYIAKDSSINDEIDKLRLSATASLAEAEKYQYTIDTEDIAAWQAVAGNLVVPEEKYFTADLKKLVERLSTGNLTVEAFTQEGNRYFEMVYQERGE